MAKNRARAQVTPPDPCEWDFRSIPENQLALATIYEFARSSSHAPVITDWLTSPFPEKLKSDQCRFIRASEREDLDRLDALKCEELTVSETIARVLDTLGESDVQPQELTRAKRGILRLLARHLPDAIINAHLHAVAVLFDQFPLQYVRLLTDRGSEYLDRRMAVATSRRSTLGPIIDLTPMNKEEAEFLARYADLPHRQHRFLIDPMVSAHELKTAFTQWLKTLDHPDTRGGRRARCEWLRWLSAYRLAKSGLSHAFAKPYLDRYVSDHPYPKLNVELPNFVQQADWDRNISRAEQTLEGDFVRVILSDFPRDDHPSLG